MLYMIWSLIFLGGCMVTDLKERNIYMGYCVVNIVFSLLINLIFQSVKWNSIVAGLGLGMFFVATSVITKGALGLGDAIMILVVGCICGIEISLDIVTWSFVLCSAISIFGIIVKRKNIKSTIPFAPFLFCGCILTILTRKAGV